MNTGKKIYKLATKLFPLNRSLSGNDNVLTLKEFKKISKNFKIKKFSSNKKVFDWKIPLEWNVIDAKITDLKGKVILDFKNNNLHLVSYSIPIDKIVTLKELKKHLFYKKKLPKAIPYRTTYYNKNWGFCLSYNQFKTLKEKKYKIKIDSIFKKGSMHYGEVLIKGKSNKEIFLSTNICHPSLANNELSGPCVLTYIAKFIEKLKNKKFSYRIIFIPETIGSISYLHKNYKKMKKNFFAGFNCVCLGDEKNFSYLSSKKGDSNSDFFAKKALNSFDKKYKQYSWLERGSDERQYCSPGINLDVASLMRSKYATYKEYHTSLDNLDGFVSSKGLQGGYDLVKKVVEDIENDFYPKSKMFCEPFMTKKKLYPLFGGEKRKVNIVQYMNLISYADGSTPLTKIAIMNKMSFEECLKIFRYLEKKLLIIFN
jgi:aminopeptidase-like protein